MLGRNYMRYTDRIYGEAEITEPVVLEILESPEMQRLKGVDQAGYFEPYFPGTKHNRFEHSLGVYLLLKKYGAPLEEQIAGLIHDVSHPVFSHAGDYYFSVSSEKNQDHQDNYFKEYVKNSRLPKILEKYNLNLEYILDDKNFPLKEKNLPDLCADRLDYSLREIIIYKVGDKKDVEYFLNHLKMENNQWIFDDFENAEKFANFFKVLNEECYCSQLAIMVTKTPGDYLKYSLEKKYISISDLYTTDDEVLLKISKYLEKDPKLKYLFARMNNKIKYKNDPNDFEMHIVHKSRIIDPLCKHNGEIKKVSEINTEWKKIIEEEMKPKEYFLKFLE
jgi:uncharacterized protein